MGSTQKQNNSSLVSHFSHQHSLEHTTLLPSTTQNINCFGCKQTLTNTEHYYKCKTCNFSLHSTCYNIPLITNHPSHPTHNLVLIIIPSSSSSSSSHATKSTFNCMACRNNITGFCYHCAQCNIFIHAQCTKLPLSISITSHSHQMKLEYSPPYDFFCDLCSKPSYNKGWLYRCNICEFDLHVACAVENMKNKVDSGWYKKLYSPLKKGSMSSIDVELQERTPLRDKSTPPSSSYQFSDSYFSIDLSKSYSKHQKNQLLKEVSSSDYISQSVMSSNFVQGEETIGVVNWLNDHLHKNKVNDVAFSKEGSAWEFGESNQKVVMKNGEESLAKWDAEDKKITKLELEKNKCIGWKKLLTCCL